ncbi:hypothetical protein M378DRAFT_176908 [Amanita muscaria Koide BX008]|uniref:Uncharacterized protein n=1 Tax=Amanita muscaria (strain Koide BX008) TaxID=946122 RepID=A0A0C2SXG6_AMAMK|nr:hypothetical protein M378DRAFT_176908 [Amanita muscaria Koide BX008]
MDNQSAIIETPTNHDIEARQRFESFKLGNGLPSALKGHRPAHTRSRSRNMSISSASSLSIPPPKPSPPSSEDAFQGMSGAQALAPSSRRNSHHRRRSSVSTRHESAEMMGVSLPDLPASSSDDFGDKDSIRRRALWALEGKPDVSFSKVEIPELSSPQMEKFMSDLPVKPTFPTVSGLSNILSNKRDSFKLLSSASSTKDQLHTLVEEDEEEEEGSSPPNPKHVAVATSPLPSLHGKGRVSVKPVLHSSRPTSLNLRPLALTSERFLTNSTRVSPSTRETAAHRTGLKTLSLSLHNSTDALAITEQRRQSFNLPPSTDSPSSLNDDGKVKRRSSICYKTSSVVTINHAGLPTPAMTPIHTDRHFSLTSVAKDSDDDECFSYDKPKSRPLSTSEQSFLVKSHHALLARISDLERALATKGSIGFPYSRADTRPSSLTSEFSITSDQTLGEPADEMLQLVSDLKAERDEYKRDVDAWRQRVKDMENKLSSMAKRVEIERREAWIAQSRVGLVEVEKTSLEKKIGCHESTLTKMENEKMALEHENQMLHDEIARALSDLARANEQLEKAQQEIETMKRSKSARLPPTPDSSDEDDGLILYEESDMSFQTSSGDSMEELSEPTSFFAFNTVGSSMLQSPPSTPDTIKMHDPKHSLSKIWTFPVGAHMVAEPCKVESDKFFGCLESGDEASNGMADPVEYSYERSKGLFSAALKAYKDDPDAALIGLAVESQSVLPSVAEEEGDQDGGLLDADEDMFGEAGGICITLTPAQDNNDDNYVPETSSSFQVSSSAAPVLPPLNFEYEVEEAPKSMSIDFSRYDVSTPAKGSRSPTSKTASTKSTSPSSIPRLRSCSKTGSPSYTAEHSTRHAQAPCSTPPRKRTIAFPSLIPQAISSPSPIRIANVYPRPRLSPLTLTRPSQPKQQSSVPLSSQQVFSRITNGSTATVYPLSV